MNDLQLANLLTMECARLDATRGNKLPRDDGESPQQRAMAPPEMFFWNAETTPRNGVSVSRSALPDLEHRNTSSSNADVQSAAATRLGVPSRPSVDFTAYIPVKVENENAKRSRPDDHKIGYVRPPTSKRRPNAWWALPQYSHLPKPTYAKAPNEKASNIRGLTRLQGTVTQDTGIRSLTHPDRVESCCDNGTYSGIWPNVTVPPVDPQYVLPLRNSHGVLLNVPAWDARGNVCEYLPAPGEIISGFDAKWDVRVPAYMTMEAVLATAVDGLGQESVGLREETGGKKSMRATRNTGKHAAARDLAHQQRTVRKVAALKPPKVAVTKKQQKHMIPCGNAGSPTIDANGASDINYLDPATAVGMLRKSRLAIYFNATSRVKI